MKQKRFDVLPGEAPAIINASESHMALVLVLDVSYSMEGNPINQLNAGLNRFKEDVCKDKVTRDVLDVAVIQFNDSYEVVPDFVPIEYMENIQLEAGGATEYTAPIREAIRMVDERSRFYRRSGSEPYKPWIILVSDGEPLDDINAVAKEVKDMQDTGKARFLALGVGDCKMDMLAKITDVVFRMDDTDFTTFFNWVGKSMRSVSTTAPGEKAPLPPLEGNVYRYVDDI
ncbi:MAG: VWA domain-containing protein [Defluviitaleaceae bacterium]|nr:VWA domain-containing protein [Defluviitaleaceae bacterium]